MTNSQAAILVNQRLRRRAQQLRALYGLLIDDVANYTGDLKAYFEPTDGSPSAWVDSRTDVPHNVTAAQVAAFEAMILAVRSQFTPELLALVAPFCVDPVYAE